MTTPVPSAAEVLPPEPLTDFSRETARQAMRSALASVKDQFGGTFGPVIDNNPVATAGFIDSLNPSHKRQLVGRCGKSSPEQARQALAAAAALVAGNSVVMKPAEQSSVIAAKLMEVFQEVGLPPGVLNYLPGIGEEVGPVLVQSPDTALIAFTGSLKVGLLIIRKIGRPP